MTSLHKNLIDNLRIARTRQRLSQARLAEMAGLSTGYITEIESGDKFPSPDSLERLAKALQTPAHSLLMSAEESQAYERFRAVSELGDDMAERIAEQIVLILSKSKTIDLNVK